MAEFYYVLGATGWSAMSNEMISYGPIMGLGFREFPETSRNHPFRGPGCNSEGGAALNP